MKNRRSYLFVIVVLAVLVAFFLFLRQREESVVPVFPDIPIEMMVEEDYINSVRGHDERDQIVGNFSGNVVDTLSIVQNARVEYVDTTANIILNGERFRADDVDEVAWKYDWSVVSSKGSVPTLSVFGLCPQLVFEGDLDQNGTDEFGILFTWETSYHRSYYVYTLYHNEWRYLIPPVETAESLRASGKDLVRPGKNRGEILVTESDFGAEYSSYSDAPDKDTVRTASFLPIN